MATVTNTDDLLILSDDDNNEDELIIQDVNNDSISILDEENISFDDKSFELDTNITENLNENSSSEDSTNTLDFGVDLDLWDDDNFSITPEVNTEDNSFDLSADITEETEEVNLDNSSVDLVTENKEEEFTLDFWDVSTENISDIEVTSEDIDTVEEKVDDNTPMFDDLNLWVAWWAIKTVWTMEEIIDHAMSDFDIRFDSIGWTKNTKVLHIADLKAQIEDLQLAVKAEEEEVTALESEQAMITKNKKALERMKIANVTTDIKNTNSTKVHNTKRKQSI